MIKRRCEPVPFPSGAGLKESLSAVVYIRSVECVRGDLSDGTPDDVQISRHNVVPDIISVYK